MPGLRRAPPSFGIKRQREEPLLKKEELEDPEPFAIKILEGHSGSIECLEISQDKIISGSSDSTIRIWDFSGNCLQILKGHFECVRCLAVSQNKIVSGSSDSTVRIWDFDGNCLKVSKGHSDCVLCLVVSQNKIVSGSADETVRIWDFDGDCLKILKARFGGVMCLVVTQNDYIISRSTDGTLLIWGFDGVCLNDIASTPSLFAAILNKIAKEDLEKMKKSLHFSQNQIIGRGEGSTLFVWDFDDNCFKILSGHPDKHCCYAISRDKIVSGGNTIRVWDANKTLGAWTFSGNCLNILNGHSRWVTCLAISQNKIVSGSHDKTLRIWTFSPWPQLRLLFVSRFKEGYDSPFHPDNFPFDMFKIICFLCS